MSNCTLSAVFYYRAAGCIGCQRDRLSEDLRRKWQTTSVRVFLSSPSQILGIITQYFNESSLTSRYVGILHEIDSANSTVSLEQVKSFGTEGRKGDPSLEIPPSDNVFEYIIFRGSDVKDLRVEQAAAPPPPQATQVPEDPAILSVRVTKGQ